MQLYHHGINRDSKCTEACQPTPCRGSEHQCVLQEKDPSADEAFAAAAALKQQSMHSAAGDQAAAHAVDGFIPKSRPTKAPTPQPGISSQPKQAAARRVTFEQLSSPSPERRVGDTSAGISQPEQAELDSQQDKEPIPSRQSPVSNGSLAMPSTPAMSDADTANHSQNLHSQQQQHDAQVTSGSVLTDTAPILSFEVDDSESPLEGSSHGLAAQFGRLKVRYTLSMLCS